MRSTLVSAVLALALLAGANNAFGGNYVRVSPDLEIYYEEAGSGRPIIFIPGWTGTNVVVAMPGLHLLHSEQPYVPPEKGPAIKINTSPIDFYPIEQVRLLRFNGTRLDIFGDVIGR